VRVVIAEDRVLLPGVSRGSAGWVPYSRTRSCSWGSMCFGLDLGFASTVPSVGRSFAHQRVRTRHPALLRCAHGCGSGRGVGSVYSNGFVLRPEPRGSQGLLTRPAEGKLKLLDRRGARAGEVAGSANRRVIAAVPLVISKTLLKRRSSSCLRRRDLNRMLWPVSLR